LHIYSYRFILLTFFLKGVPVKSTGLFLSIVSLVSMGCCAMQTQFFVRDQVGDHEVQRQDVSPFLRSLSPKQLQKYSDVGNKIRAIRLSNGDYRVQEEGTIKGGGPGLGMVLYWSINVASAATAASLAWCPPAAAAVAIGGHVVATVAAIAATGTPTP
jgi:hypothetical protein